MLLFSSVFMLFHSIYVTTSRLESALSAGLLYWIFIKRWPVLRFLGNLIYLIVICTLIYFLFANNLNVFFDEFSGRNFSFASSAAWDALPLGNGLINDISLYKIFNPPSGFYFSDYGLLLYIFRYGFFGIVISMVFLGFWGAFFLRTLKYKGSFLFQLAILLNIAFVPMLDYSGLGGAFIITSMVYVIFSSSSKPGLL